jgi:hypothetical protein
VSKHQSVKEAQMLPYKCKSIVKSSKLQSIIKLTKCHKVPIIKGHHYCQSGNLIFNSLQLFTAFIPDGGMKKGNFAISALT